MAGAGNIGQHGVHRMRHDGLRISVARTMDQVIGRRQIGLAHRSRIVCNIPDVRVSFKAHLQALKVPAGGVDRRFRSGKQIHNRRTDQSGGAGDQDAAPFERGKIDRSARAGDILCI